MKLNLPTLPIPRKLAARLSTITAAIALALTQLMLAQEPPMGPASPIKDSTLEVLFQLTERIYSGSEPSTEEHFAELAKRGIKTIVSVDGAEPNLALAQKYGLSYIHLPMGYGGMGREQTLKIARAMEIAQGPVMLHCHHGKHRGPSAAAVACIAEKKWTNDQAAQWLKQVGTSPSYRQMIADVQSFTLPTTEEKAAMPRELPNKVAPPPLVDSMVQISHAWEELAAIGKPPKAGTLVTKAELTYYANESLQLMEQFVELARDPTIATLPEPFQVELKKSVEAATALQTSLADLAKSDQLDTTKLADLPKLHSAIGTSCKACHTLYRDNSGAQRKP